MRVYLYRCVEGHQFERSGGLDDDLVHCECGQPARRRPFSSVPYIKGETVARSIPDPVYRMEAEKRELHSTWGDASRSVEMLRKNVFEDANGNKQINLKGMT